MKCKQAKASIALWVGNDLEEEGLAGELERHVTICPCCRDFWKKILQTQQVFGRVDDTSFASDYHGCDSIWDDVSDKIDHNQEQYQRERFNGWVPALAVVSVCLLLLFYSHSYTQHTPVSQPAFEVSDHYSDLTFPDSPQFNNQTSPPFQYDETQTAEAPLIIPNLAKPEP